MSTPKSLQLPSGVQRRTIETSRGAFAALEALPLTGVPERQPALLIPGYTGSKEDFLLILQALAAAGRRVVAIDMRGQFETPGGTDPAGYQLAALAADVAAIAGRLTEGLERRDIHLLGHSLGGLVAREAVLAPDAGPAEASGSSPAVGSLTLMSSGPGALTGPRAAVLQTLLAELNGTGPEGLQAEVKRIWQTRLEPEAVAGGVPGEIIGFLRTRLLHSSPTGLRAMGEVLLGCPDRTQALADLGGLPLMVLYGENDDAWAPATQEEMAARLGAQRVCIPAAAHSPAVEAPDTTASTLTGFWNAVECGRTRPRN